jgi:hypothetical protein
VYKISEERRRQVVEVLLRHLGVQPDPPAGPVGLSLPAGGLAEAEQREVAGLLSRWRRAAPAAFLGLLRAAVEAAEKAAAGAAADRRAASAWPPAPPPAPPGTRDQGSAPQSPYRGGRHPR